MKIHNNLNYIIIDKAITEYTEGRRKNEDIYLMAYIKLCSDYETGISIVTEQKLSERTGISINTIPKMIKRLKQSSLVEITTTQNGIKRHNSYKFELDPENYFFVNSAFFHDNHISVRHRGFLLNLKAICLNHTNYTLYNKSQIKKSLKQDSEFVSARISELLRSGLVKNLDNNGYLLPTNYFPNYTYANKIGENWEVTKFNEIERFVYNEIIKFCHSKGCMLFLTSNKLIKYIAGKYHQTVKYDNPEMNQEYIPYVLNKRFDQLPERIDSISYFTQALNIEVPENVPESSSIIL